MENQNNGWDKINVQNEKSVKDNKKKDNYNTGYNLSMGLITIIIIGAVIFSAVGLQVLRGF